MSEWAKDGNKTRAYRDAGYKPDPANACHLTRNHKVIHANQALLERFRTGLGKEFRVTREKVLKDLEFGKMKAVELGQMGPYMRACELQGKEAEDGQMFVMKHEHELKTVPDTELVKALSRFNPELAQVAAKALAIKGEYEVLPVGDN